MFLEVTYMLLVPNKQGDDEEPILYESYQSQLRRRQYEPVHEISQYLQLTEYRQVVALICPPLAFSRSW